MEDQGLAGREAEVDGKPLPHVARVDAHAITLVPPQLPVLEKDLHVRQGRACQGSSSPAQALGEQGALARNVGEGEVVCIDLLETEG